MSRLKIAAVLGAVLGFAILPSRAAELKQETLDAWDHYLHSADAQMRERAKGRFLWVDEAPGRVARVHSGEVLVAPLGHTPVAVPGGLVHHWIGAAFIPGARIEDVITVVRSYDRYTQYYRPSVLDAKTISRKDQEDRFTVVIADKSMFMQRALDSRYESRYVEVDSRKWYSVSYTTSVQEVADFAQPDEHRIPDGEGSGYIWRLCTMSRYEERDGGVYIETEAMALSRTIPMTLRWVVDPIVRRVSRSSLTMSLEQTRDATGSAVRSTAALTASRRIHHSAANE